MSVGSLPYGVVYTGTLHYNASHYKACVTNRPPNQQKPYYKAVFPHSEPSFGQKRAFSYMYSAG